MGFACKYRTSRGKRPTNRNMSYYKPQFARDRIRSSISTVEIKYSCELTAVALFEQDCSVDAVT